MKKVTVTSEQAKALEALKKTWDDKETSHFYPIIIKEKLRGGWNEYSDYTAAESLSDDDFIKALYFGYEIEATPEHKVFEYYREAMRKFDDEPLASTMESYYDGETDGIVNTLNLLGITIEGVTN